MWRSGNGKRRWRKGSRRGGEKKGRGKSRGGSTVVKTMTDIDADVKMAVVVAGNVGKGENGTVLAAVAFHTTTSQSRQEAQDGATRGRGNGTTRGRGSSRQGVGVTKE